jgi:hypothetical protein
MTFLIFDVLLFALTCGTALEGPAESPPASIESGYRQMYNLEFEKAHQTFQSWQQSHPDDPLGPSSDSAAFLFSEFNRLGILQAELFADDVMLKKSKRRTPDPAFKKGFEDSLAKSDRLADVLLARSPQDKNALFAKLLNLGLRADYAGLIEKRFLASLAYMKNGRILAEKLLAIDPSNYDSYLAVGVENYILGSSPAPVRWILQIFGSRTDKLQGIEKVRLTAEKGRYLLPYARLLLAVAALRDKDRDKARDLLDGLAREFPNNPLYARELARLQ